MSASPQHGRRRILAIGLISCDAGQAMTDDASPAIFDRRLYALRRARAAQIFEAHDFLHRQAMADIVDRLETVTRDFPRALFYGVGALGAMTTPRCGVIEVVHADLAASRLPASPSGVVFDEEAQPFPSASFDLVVSLLTLHHANDLIGALSQIRRSLKPDGLFLGVLFAEDTLIELRGALYAAEAEVAGGVSPRISPFATVRDLGGALQRAGFALPVADVDHVDVAYLSASRLFADLRGMGESAPLRRRGRGLSRASLARAAAILEQSASIRFDLATLTGWAPHESQQRPLKPGSARHSLAAAVQGE